MLFVRCQFATVGDAGFGHLVKMTFRSLSHQSTHESNASDGSMVLSCHPSVSPGGFSILGLCNGSCKW